MGIRSAHKFSSQNIREEDHLVDVDVDDKMILKEVLQKQDMRLWPGCNKHETESSAGVL